MQDRRKHLRVTIKIPVTCELDGEQAFDATATDISLGGSRIECAKALEIGVRLMIVARLPGATEPSRLPAIVRWIKPGSFGVQFGLLGARDTYRIADLMAKAVRSNRTG